MQYVLAVVLVAFIVAGLGIFTDWKFFLGDTSDHENVMAAAVEPPQVLIFNSNPSSISRGEKSDIVWAVSNATSIFIDPDIGTVDSAGMLSVAPDKTTTFTIVATNSAETVTRSLTVPVNQPVAPPVITSFTSSSANTTPGQPVTLKWNTLGADKVTIDNGIGSVAEAGSCLASPYTPTTYTLTAKNEGGSVTSSISIAILPTKQPVILDFSLTYFGTTSSTCNITAGDDVIMRWDITGADSVNIDNGIGTVSANGILTLNPISATVYTLTARNEAGSVTRLVTINVEAIDLPAINTFELVYNPILYGESSTLKWSVSNADTISINQNIGPVNATGIYVVSPLSNTTYTITATNGEGTVVSSVSLIITPLAQPTIVSFTASPAYIKSGQSSTLQWNVTGASSISISSVGAVASSGSVTVSPAATTKYTLTAYNSVGSITGFATVTVTE